MKLNVTLVKGASIPLAATNPLAGLLDFVNEITDTSGPLNTIPGLAAPLAALGNDVSGVIPVASNRSLLNFRDSAGAPVSFKLLFGTFLLQVRFQQTSSSQSFDLGRLAGLSDPASVVPQAQNFFTSNPKMALIGAPAVGGALTGQPAVESGFSAGPNSSNVQVVFPSAQIVDANTDTEAYIAAFSVPLFNEFASGSVKSIGLRWQNVLTAITTQLASYIAAIGTGTLRIDVTANFEVDVTIPPLPNGNLTPTYALVNHGETVNTSTFAGFNSPVAAAVNALNSVKTGFLTVTPPSQGAIRVSTLTQAVQFAPGGISVNVPAAGGVLPNPVVVGVNTNLIVSPV